MKNTNIFFAPRVDKSSERLYSSSDWVLIVPVSLWTSGFLTSIVFVMFSCLCVNEWIPDQCCVRYVLLSLCDRVDSWPALCSLCSPVSVWTSGFLTSIVFVMFSCLCVNEWIPDQHCVRYVLLPLCERVDSWPALCSLCSPVSVWTSGFLTSIVFVMFSCLPLIYRLTAHSTLFQAAYSALSRNRPKAWDVKRTTPALSRLK
jgi:hypothetical protein